MIFNPSQYDAVMYDLDGTLVKLVVDWDVVTDDFIDVYIDNMIGPPATIPVVYSTRTLTMEPVRKSRR